MGDIPSLHLCANRCTNEWWTNGSTKGLAYQLLQTQHPLELASEYCWRWVFATIDNPLYASVTILYWWSLSSTTQSHFLLKSTYEWPFFFGHPYCYSLIGMYNADLRYSDFKLISIERSSDGYTWRFPNCKTMTSIQHNSFFTKSWLTLQKWLLMM